MRMLMLDCVTTDCFSSWTVPVLWNSLVSLLPNAQHCITSSTLTILIEEPVSFLPSTFESNLSVALKISTSWPDCRNLTIQQNIHEMPEW